MSRGHSFDGAITTIQRPRAVISLQRLRLDLPQFRLGVVVLRIELESLVRKVGYRLARE
jgi:hypothetical protein